MYLDDSVFSAQFINLVGRDLTLISDAFNVE